MNQTRFPLGRVEPDGSSRCADLARLAGEELAGTAPMADVWVAVEHPQGWGEAPLARAESGVRVVLVRGPGRDRPVSWSATGVRVWVGYATDPPVLRVGWVERPEAVAGWDLAAVAAGSARAWGAADPDPLLLVCANGRRDRCCGHSGGRLADSLWHGSQGDRVLTCTHLGGHRFAPTALLLPIGALHGRLDAASAEDLLSGARAGRMRSDTLRGFSTLPEAAQIGDAHVRGRTGHRGLAPLSVDLLPDEDPHRALARVRVPGTQGAPEREEAAWLVNRTATAVLGCGRSPEPTNRWGVA